MTLRKIFAKYRKMTHPYIQAQKNKITLAQ